MKILIVDSYPLFRWGIKRLLVETFDTAVVTEADDRHCALEQVRAQTWDVILLDIGLRTRNGLDCLADIKRICPAAKVLILTAYPEMEYAVPALRAGASGYVPKDCQPQVLLKAIKLVLSGRRYLSPELADHLACVSIEGVPADSHATLSAREFQVFLGVAAGSSVKDLAEKLHLSDRTVSTYRARILAKMGLNTNAALTEYCVRNGLWSDVCRPVSPALGLAAVNPLALSEMLAER